ncbi:MAG: exo-beta-N-acetylmuramidase NamZ domain-containing protein [Bacteroidia bacterium]
MFFRRPKDSYLILVLLFFINSCFITAQNKGKILTDNDVLNGAERTDIYFPYLSNKKIAVVANQSSMIGNTHLVDSLLAAGFSVKKVFCPEHGFRGVADAGENIKNYTDKKTGLPIISLYGSNKKPKPEHLKGIDMVIFDLQDVGARFYTYISTMHYVMESCAENNLEFIVLDRPNPNGFYVDGPVLDKRYKSFVGMHPVPIVHGMTVGEYAQMINEEKWLENGLKCKLNVVKVEGYTHHDFYQLPVKPSPNLSEMAAVYLYPSLCLFEGTIVSVGRGTTKPFQQIGHPDFKNMPHQFVPKSTSGAKSPMYMGLTCYGFNLEEHGKMFIQNQPYKLDLQWLIKCYNAAPNKETFFNNFFNNLSGTDVLKQQIIEGISEEEIRKNWQIDLSKFKQIRKKYLLYEDFE